MPPLTVAVIFGGRSVEHDVSIVTAHQVMAVLAAKHNVVPIYVTRDGRWLSAPELNDLDVYKKRRWDEVGEDAFIPPSAGYKGLYIPGGRLKKARRVALDVVVPSVHGTYGEDGTLQGLLELAGIPYTGSGVVGSAVGMDKIAMKAAFAAAGIPIVPHVELEAARVTAEPAAVIQEVEKAIGYPTFVKPARLGSSVGIGKASDRTELAHALEVACSYDRRLLVEQAMEGCIEVNCSVLGGPGHEPRPSVCEQPVAVEEWLTFSDKYLGPAKGGGKGDGMAGQKRLIPAPIGDALTATVQDHALRAFRAIDAAGVARVDAFVDQDAGSAWVMEINTVPGSFSFYLWEPAGVAFDELMDSLIEVAFKTDKIKSELMFTYESGMLEGMEGMEGAKRG
jgi:D-alanine-D-alanine ligase